MVVNTASKCGLTPQYEQLEKLYKQYSSKNFVIIGFPANNFLSQEPGTNSEIIDFCTKNYGVTFPMMAKISVKGDDIHPLYKWLTATE
jgi:glutathione peroxidase